VGQSPGAYALIQAETQAVTRCQEASGDLSVCAHQLRRTPALLTMIPVGDRPREIAVKLF